MKNTSKIWLIAGITAVASLLITCALLTACLDIIVNSDEEDEPETGLAPEYETAEPAAGVTLDNFNVVENGMTYYEVSEIFGRPGDLTTEGEYAGIKTEVYFWAADKGFAYATVSFEDGWVVSKAQFGLE